MRIAGVMSSVLAYIVYPITLLITTHESQKLWALRFFSKRRLKP